MKANKPWRVARWDICPKLHAMNDFGYKDGTRKFGRTRTYNAECYAEKDREDCTRQGKCILAYEE